MGNRRYRRSFAPDQAPRGRPAHADLRPRVRRRRQRTGAPQLIGDGGSVGRLTATCNDQAPRAAVEDPITELNFVNTSGDFIDVAERVPL